MGTKAFPKLGRAAEGGQVGRLRAALPSSTNAPEKRSGAVLQINVPPELLRDLKVKAATDDTTLRHIVLKALKDAGWGVDDDELKDRRRG
jgi:hypothetical protein